MNKKRLILIFAGAVFLFSIILLFFIILSLRKISWSPPAAFLPQPKPIVSLPPFSLRSIFSQDHSWVNQLPADQTFSLITTGDVIPARTVNYKMVLYNDFCHPFLKTADLLRSADLTLINLESPLINDCPITNEGMVFCGDQRFIKGLVFAGIDVVNLANNHTANYGLEGMEETIELLENTDILTCGYPSNELKIRQSKNLKIGFLGWNFLENFDPEKVSQIIGEAKKKVDLVVVSCHWSAEYQPLPAPNTVNLAHQLIEAGADLIVGNHPHWIQPLETYQDKLIIYAHGNFIFDQEWSQETKTGYVVKITFFQKKIVDVQILPVFISDFNQPEFLSGQEKEEVLQVLEERSLSLTQKASP